MGARLDVNPFNPRAGDKVVLIARGLDANGNEIKGSTFSFTSDNAAVGSVMQNGELLTYGEGTITVTATCTSADAEPFPTASQTITVRPHLVELLLSTAGSGTGSLSVFPLGITGTLALVTAVGEDAAVARAAAGDLYEARTEVTITAHPDQGSTLEGFTGPCDVQGTACIVSMIPPGPIQVAAYFALCDKSYCGNIRIADGTLSGQRVGFGYSWTGWFRYSFDPAPRAGIRIEHRLNASSVSGVATTNGTASLTIPFSGSSVACQFVNPSAVVLTDLDRPIPVLAIIEFTWNGGSCGETATLQSAGAQAVTDGQPEVGR